MKLFNFGKKKEESCCYCGGESSNKEENCNCVDSSVGIQSIKVLGSGCKSCHEMYENTKKALNNIGSNVEVEYVTDMEKVMTYGIISMPALVVNEKVVSMGKVLNASNIEKLFHKIGF